MNCRSVKSCEYTFVVKDCTPGMSRRDLLVALGRQLDQQEEEMERANRPF